MFELSLLALIADEKFARLREAAKRHGLALAAEGAQCDRRPNREGPLAILRRVLTGIFRVWPCALLSFVVATLVPCPILCAAASTPNAAMFVVPGHALGPVTLGMPAALANVAAARFTRATGRVIDLLLQDGAVAAAGTAGGPHIDLQLPNDSESFLPRDSIGGPSTVQINGSPDLLVNIFGAPRVVSEGRDKVTLVFATGLVVQVERSRATGVSLTYVAIQAARTMAVPPIGHFIAWPERRAAERASRSERRSIDEIDRNN